MALSIEKLEDRRLMAVIPLVSGQATTFHDADGTQVKVKLVGPGQGSIELTNGQLTGAGIDNLVLNGTTGASKLKISTRGGSVAGTTINELVITKALNELGALRHLKARHVDFASGGQFVADGNIDDVQFRSLGVDASIDVTGNVGRLKAHTLNTDSSVEISGVLQKFVAELLNSGSQVAAGQIDMLKVKQQADGATFDVGEGGLGKANINNLYNSAISADGGIGEVLVHGEITGSALAANIDKGSDGIFGTIDDFVVDQSAVGNINAAKFRGRVGAAGTSEEVNIVTSGLVGRLYLSREAEQANTSPSIWIEAASRFIPLSISQAALEATGFEDDEIWIAVFGEEIAIPGPSEVPPPNQAYYLDANVLHDTIPVLTTTQTLVPSSSTPNLPIIPSYTIEDWKASPSAKLWGSYLAFPVPKPGHQWTGRIVISAGAPVQAQVNQDAYHSVSAPSAGDPTDPSTGTFYDFLEFTVTNSASSVISLDMDTSQVDSFGMPIGLQFFKDAAGTLPFNFTINGSTNGNNQITGVTNLNQLVLEGLGTGQPITGPSGSGIPAGTFISGYDIASQTIYLSQAASTSQSVTLTAYAGGEVGVEATRDVIVSGSTNNALFEFLQNQVAAGNSQAGAFLQTAAPFRTAGAQQISGASNAAPIVITTYDTTGLANGDMVTISGVTGNTAANGTYTISGLTPTTFVLDGTTGSGTYASGGTWSMAITGASNPASAPIIIDASDTMGLQNGDLVEITGVQGNPAANGIWFVSNVSSTQFTLVGSTGNGTYTSGGTWNVYAPGNRLVSPKDIVEGLASPQDLSTLNNYFNEVIDAFFVNYAASGVPVGNSGTAGNQTFSLVSTAFNNTALTYSGQVQLDSTYNAYALTLTEMTGTDPTTYKIYYPLFSSNTPADYTPLLSVAATTPPWIISQGWSDQSASQMIFACDAVFADNVARATYDMTATGAVAVLGDLEDSISAAFNRGIVLNTPSTWDQTATWFQQNASQAATYGIQPGTYNYWVQYWHQTGLTYGDLAYAFPYDDKFGASTNLDLTNVGLAQITLGQWTGSYSVTPSTTVFQSLPSTSTATGSLTLTAHVTGTNPTGTVTFFIDGIPINSIDGSSTPPIEPIAINGSGVATITAQMPVLPSGTATATYTVTAVYSGDVNNLPSIAYDSLQIVEPIAVAITPNGGVLGSEIELQATLPGTNFAGTLAFTISHSDGTGSQALTSLTPTSVNVTVPSAEIPQNLLQFTGNTSSGSPTITGVSSVVDLQAGQTIMGTGVPTGATILSVDTSLNTVTLNTNATATSISAVTFTSNGAGADFVITASFTPSGSGNPAAGTAILNVTADPYSLLLAPGSGALGSTPTMTVTLPGPLYNGTVEFFISLSDGTESQSLGTVNVSSSTLSNGNQIVADDLAIPADLLTFTAYSDGSGTLTGLSTISNLVPNIQNISGGGVATNTLTGYTPATLTLTNPAAGTSTEPVTFTAGGVTITGMTTQNQQAVQVTSVSGWTLTTNLNSVSITDNAQNQYVGTGNTIQNFAPTTATTSVTVPTSASPITFTSGANGQTYPITATWTPAGGTPLPTSQLFAVSL